MKRRVLRGISGIVILLIACVAVCTTLVAGDGEGGGWGGGYMTAGGDNSGGRTGSGGGSSYSPPTGVAPHIIAVVKDGTIQWLDDNKQSTFGPNTIDMQASSNVLQRYLTDSLVSPGSGSLISPAAEVFHPWELVNENVVQELQYLQNEWVAQQINDRRSGTDTPIGPPNRNTKSSFGTEYGLGISGQKHLPRWGEPGFGEINMGDLSNGDLGDLGLPTGPGMPRSLSNIPSSREDGGGGGGGGDQLENDKSKSDISTMTQGVDEGDGIKYGEFLRQNRGPGVGDMAQKEPQPEYIGYGPGDKGWSANEKFKDALQQDPPDHLKPLWAREGRDDDEGSESGLKALTNPPEYMPNADLSMVWPAEPGGELNDMPLLTNENMQNLQEAIQIEHARVLGGGGGGNPDDSGLGPDTGGNFGPTTLQTSQGSWNYDPEYALWQHPYWQKIISPMG